MSRFLRSARYLATTTKAPPDKAVQMCAALNARMRAGGLPKLLGFKIDNLSVEDKTVSASMMLKNHHLAPNGFCHAGSIVSFADTACGAGTFMLLPDKAKNFTTVELKSNFVSTALEGELTCRATQLHGGKTTQVWDATVLSSSTGKPMAYFRATQLIMY